MLEENPQVEKIMARVAALDIGKAEVVCCVRVPHEGTPGRRSQEVATSSTMTRSLLALSDHPRCLGGESGGDGGRPGVLKTRLFSAEGSGAGSLAGQRQERQTPAGTAQDGHADAVWLRTIAKRQMIRPSSVPPPEIRRLRDVSRYRTDLVGMRTAEKQRVEKLLENTQIKLSVMTSDIFGVSGQEMMAAPVTGADQPPGVGAASPGSARAPSSERWKSRSPGNSPITTGCC
jgi:transposase